MCFLFRNSCRIVCVDHTPNFSMVFCHSNQLSFVVEIQITANNNSIGRTTKEAAEVLSFPSL